MREHLVGMLVMTSGMVSMAVQNYTLAVFMILWAYILWGILTIEELCIPNKAERNIKAKAVTEFAEKLKEYYPSIADGIDYTAEEVLKD